MQVTVDQSLYPDRYRQDRQITPDFLAGAFFAYEDKKVKNADTRNSRSKVDGYSAGLYAAANAQGFEFRAGASYGWLDLNTKREINAGTLQGQVKADYKGSKVQIFAEAARPFTVNENFTLAPYLNVAQIWLKTNALTETGNAAALDIARQTDSVRVSTLGFRTTVTLPMQPPVKLTADLGWMHAFGDINSKTSNRFAGRGSRFDIAGAGVDKNAAIAGLALQAQVTPNTSFTVGYQGQFGSNVNNHTGQVQVRVRF